MISVFRDTHRIVRCSPRRSPQRLGFTLVELLAIIAIVGILVAMLMPAMNAARDTARRTQCLSNLRQIGFALNQYIDAKGSEGTYPGMSICAEMPNSSSNINNLPGIQVLLGPYCETKNSSLTHTGVAQNTQELNQQQIFQCPSDVDTITNPDATTTSYFKQQGTSYDYLVGKYGGKTRVQALMASDLHTISATLVFIVCEYTCFHGDPSSGVGMNFLYADGHVADQ